MKRLPLYDKSVRELQMSRLPRQIRRRLNKRIPGAG
jgi:hypothetical protein